MRDVCRRVGNGKRVDEGGRAEGKEGGRGVRNAVMLKQIKDQIKKMETGIYMEEKMEESGKLHERKRCLYVYRGSIFPLKGEVMICKG